MLAFLALIIDQEVGGGTPYLYLSLTIFLFDLFL